MQTVYDEGQTQPDAPISVEYITSHGRYMPAHWHPELEMIFILNGNASVIVEGTRYSLVQGDFIVIDGNAIHETHCVKSLMMISVHVSRDFIRSMMAGSRPFLIRCSRDDLVREQLDTYLAICELFKKLPPLYVAQPRGSAFEIHAVIMNILYLLVRDFSLELKPDDIPSLTAERQRVQEIASYIEKHYREELTLGDIAAHFGLSREYFSRYFKKNFGITFLQHLSRVRVGHIYHDLIATDTPIMELLDEHGFKNYKLFSRMFKTIYGCTPREARKAGRE